MTRMYCVCTIGIKMTRQTDIVILNDIKADRLKEKVCDLFMDMTLAFISLQQDECLNRESELNTVTLVFP